MTNRNKSWCEIPYCRGLCSWITFLAISKISCSQPVRITSFSLTASLHAKQQTISIQNTLLIFLQFLYLLHISLPLFDSRKRKKKCLNIKMTNLFRQVASNERMAWRRLLLDLKIMVSIKWRGNCIPSAIAMFSKIVASCEVKSL